MSYRVLLSSLALDHIHVHKKSGNKTLLKKIEHLLDELKTHPYSGTGKPELLKFQYAGQWSHRINKAHRLIYSVNEPEVLVHVISAMGHYGDK